MTHHRQSLPALASTLNPFVSYTPRPRNPKPGPRTPEPVKEFDDIMSGRGLRCHFPLHRELEEIRVVGIACKSHRGARQEEARLHVGDYARVSKSVKTERVRVSKRGVYTWEGTWVLKP